MRLINEDELIKKLAGRGYNSCCFPGFFACIEDTPTRGHGETPSWVAMPTLPPVNAEVLIKAFGHGQLIARYIGHEQWLVKSVNRWEKINEYDVRWWRPLPE